MKPLHVTLIHRASDNYRRLTGWWSYPVPEFTWDTFKVPPVNFHAEPNLDKTDLIVLDDWIFGKVEKRGKPMAYVTVDSARSPEQLRRNLDQGKQADMMLVDSDRLDKFAGLGIPVRRFAYSVNERLYKAPLIKEFDVAFLCWPTEPRITVRSQVKDICERHGWSFLNGTYHDPYKYAEMLTKAKIVVHKAHVQDARSWRFFDVMASRGCLLSNPVPLVDGDGIVPGVHYHEYRDDLEAQLFKLMDNGAWEETAQRGWRHVIDNHTWKVRAKQLRQMLAEDLGL